MLLVLGVLLLHVHFWVKILLVLVPLIYSLVALANMGMLSIRIKRLLLPPIVSIVNLVGRLVLSSLVVLINSITLLNHLAVRVIHQMMRLQVVLLLTKNQDVFICSKDVAGVWH